MFIVVYLETPEKRKEANKYQAELNIASTVTYLLAVSLLDCIHLHSGI